MHKIEYRLRHLGNALLALLMIIGAWAFLLGVVYLARPLSRAWFGV